MQEFMMIFRMAPMGDYQPDSEEIAYWQNWIGSIAAQGKFVSANQLEMEGKTLKSGGIITDGPYAEIKEIVGGYIIVKAENMDEALKLADGCPILHVDGHVEVRGITANQA